VDEEGSKQWLKFKIFAECLFEKNVPIIPSSMEISRRRKNKTALLQKIQKVVLKGKLQVNILNALCNTAAPGTEEAGFCQEEDMPHMVPL
jgi:hypothetical protein